MKGREILFLARNYFGFRKSPTFIGTLALFLLFVMLWQQLRELFREQETPVRSDQFAVSRTHSLDTLDITVVIIVSNLATFESEYKTALESVKCYTEQQKYRLELVEDSDYRHLCVQEKFAFRRHCIVSNLLRESDWVFLLDADTAVVNPKVRLEDYIVNEFDLALYDKFANWEIATGSYIVKNTFWARDFLMKLADFEGKIPSSGDDNAAIHVLLQKTFYPQFADEVGNCGKILDTSSENRDALYSFEACVRSVIGENHEFEKLRILKKGTAWVRDIWLTDSKWNKDRDFMLGGLRESQNSQLSQGILSTILLGKYTWRTPFLMPLNSESCELEKWEFDPELMTTKTEIEEFLTKKYEEVERLRWNSLARVGERLQKK